MEYCDLSFNNVAFLLYFDLSGNDTKGWRIITLFTFLDILPPKLNHALW